MTYRTNDGDMLDAICFFHYAPTVILGAVYDANPILAFLGAVLPKGVGIILPQQVQTTPRNPIRLWGDSDAT